MKKTAFIISLFAVVFMSISTVSAQDPDDRKAGVGWRAQFEDMLEEGKKTASLEGSSADTGLGYTESEANALYDAISFALSEEKGRRACECLQTAVEYEYNPYLVLKTIYGVGGDLEIDELCTCATETGMTKAIIALAATDAVDELDEPVFEPNEISRSQCLTGLAYQLDAGETRNQPDPDVSISTL